MPSQRLLTPSLTVPAGTPTTAPVSLLLYSTVATISRLEVVVPPGPSGLVGFVLRHSNEQVVPEVSGTWIIADNEKVDLSLERMSAQPDWHLSAYNTDLFAHTLYVRLVLTDADAPTAPLPDLVSLE